MILTLKQQIPNYILLNISVVWSQRLYNNFDFIPFIWIFNFNIYLILNTFNLIV